MPNKISKEEWEQRINYAGAGWYEFARWDVEGEFGSRAKCVVRSAKAGFEWVALAKNMVNIRSKCPRSSERIRWTANGRVEQINSLENIEFISWFDGYKNADSIANVRCLNDGFEWSVRVKNILGRGSGCPQCAGQRKWTTEERVEQINSIENVEFVSWIDGYKNVKSKAAVRCVVDGHEWSVGVNELVNKSVGCPSCAKYGYDPSKSGFLYALRSECGLYLKVGISNNPSQRHRTLKLETPFSFSCIEQFEDDGTKIAEMEKYFHNKYERAGFTGFDGATEWLVCTPQLLEELREFEDVK